MEEEVCPICLDSFINPTTLSWKSGHQLCGQCYEVLPSKEQTKDKRRTIECPLCRAESFSEVHKEEKKNVEVVIKPRNTKLLEEFEASIGRGGVTFIPLEHTGMIGYGVDEDNDMNLDKWSSIIIGPQDSPIGQVIYNLMIEVPEEYPIAPPKVRFVSPKISMSCVNSQGWVTLDQIEKVDITKVNNEGMVEKGVGKKYEWNPTNNIADVLVVIREMMYLKSVATPSGGCASGNYC